MRLLFALLLALTRPWLVVSDLHVNPFDRDNAPAGYESDTNWPLFDSSIRAMRAADPQAPVVVISGDFLAHQFSAKARAAGANPTEAALAAMARIAGSFNRAFPHAQFLIALGNNDDPCGDYRASPNSPYLHALAKIWAPLVNRRGAAPDFVRDFSFGGYYDSHVEGVHAIVLDDVLWSVIYRSCGGAGAEASEFSWLASLRPSQQPAALVMHIPPGIDPSATLLTHRFVVVPYWNPGTRARFERIVAHLPIGFAIAGHLHRLDFRIEDNVPVLVTSSISPIYGNNPSFITLDIANARIRDYAVYVFDGSASWQRAASFRAAFGASGFSTSQLAAIHARIASDLSVRHRWAQLATGESDAASQVLGSWRAYWCAQSEFGRGYIACAGDQRRVAFVGGAALAVAVVAIALAVWYSRRRQWKRKRNGA